MTTDVLTEMTNVPSRVHGQKVNVKLNVMQPGDQKLPHAERIKIFTGRNINNCYIVDLRENIDGIVVRSMASEPFLTSSELTAFLNHIKKHRHAYLKLWRDQTMDLDELEEMIRATEGSEKVNESLNTSLRPVLIYLHGFGSAGRSAKSDALRKEFGTENVLSPDLPYDPNEVKKLINDMMRKLDHKTHAPVVFVGTSLGGFYANYFAQKWDCPAVLVNPATVPSRTLYNRIGYNKNFATGQDFLWEPEFVETLAKMEKEVSTIHSGGLVNLFVAKDDDVIDHRETLGNYPYTAHTEVYNKGGHRFEDGWAEVVDHIKKILAS